MSIYSTPLKSNWDGGVSLPRPSSNALSMGNTTNAALTSQHAPIGGASSFNGNMVNTFSGLQSGLNGSAVNPLNFNAASEHIRINGLGTANPLDLASQYIDHLQRRDNSTPVLDERSYYNNGVNYNFSKEIGGLGPFTPFERTNVINIPDEILQQVSKAEIKSNMGLFPEIDRCWICLLYTSRCV